MICLDTNYLIRGLVAGSTESAALVGWANSGELLVTASPCWYEFLCGPVSELQTETMRAFLQSILPFEAQQAAEAAWMFQTAGRPRRLRVDTMIAACAKLANARLATSNADDFRPFEALGLQLVR